MGLPGSDIVQFRVHMPVVVTIHKVSEPGTGVFQKHKGGKVTDGALQDFVPGLDERIVVADPGSGMKTVKISVLLIGIMFSFFPCSTKRQVSKRSAFPAPRNYLPKNENTTIWELK